MKTVKLSDVAEVRLGRQRSPKNHSGPSNRPYVRAANVGWHGLILDDVKTMNFTDAEMEVYRLQRGDLLLNEASGSPREVGKPAIWMGEIDECAFQNTLIRVRPGPDAEPRYLLHYLRQQAMSAAFARGSRGVGINHLGREALARWPIPLPPLDEQRRIAAILDQADSLRRLSDERAARLSTLAAAIFIEMFGDPTTACIAGATMKLGDVADLQGGRNIVADDSDAATKYRVLKISAVTSGVFRPSESKPLPPGYEPPDDHFVKTGDLLISRANTADLVGAVAYVRETPKNLALPDKIWRFVWKDPNAAPVFYWALLRTDAVRKWIGQLSSGTGGSMKNISKAKLLQLEIPDVPVSDQQRYVERLAAIPQADSSIYKELFASLQSRAFSGQL